MPRRRMKHRGTKTKFRHVYKDTKTTYVIYGWIGGRYILLLAAIVDIVEAALIYDSFARENPDNDELNFSVDEIPEDYSYLKPIEYKFT